MVYAHGGFYQQYPQGGEPPEFREDYTRARESLPSISTALFRYQYAGGDFPNGTRTGAAPRLVMSGQREKREKTGI